MSERPPMNDASAPEAAPGAGGRIQREERGIRGAFFVERGGERVAELTYVRTGPAGATIDHTYVDPALRGRGLARALVAAAVAWAREHGVKLTPACSYARRVMQHDRSLHDVLAAP